MIRPITLLPIVLILLLLAISGCSSDSTGSDETEPPDDQNLPSIDFSSESAAPFTPIGFTGLPESEDESDLWAEVVFDADLQIQVPIYKEGGNWLMRSPFHVNEPLSGGEVEIFIAGTSGAVSQREPFRIEALPNSPGEFVKVSTGLTELLTKYLVITGTSRQELDSVDPKSLDDVRAPLYLAYWVIDNPANENNLLNIAAGSAPILNENDADVDLMNAFSSAAGILDHVNLANQSIDSLELKNRAGASRIPTADYQAFRTAANGVDEPGNIDAELLSTLMWAAEYASIHNNKYGKDIMNKTGQALAIISLAAPLPPVKAASGAMGAAIYGIATILSAIENTYPSRFVETNEDFTINPTDFPEDSDGGSWQMNVVAASKGWSLDKAALEGLLQFVGAKGAKNLSAVVENSVELSARQEVFVEAILGSALGDIINGATGDPSTGIARIPEQLWTSNVTELSKISIVEGNAVKVDPIRFDGISTEKVGTARVRGEKKEGEFGYQALLRFKNVEVHAIIVSVSPDKINVEPGDPVFFSSEVQWAKDQSLEWSTTAGEIFGGSDGQKTAVLRTPEERWDDPIEVTATSTSTGGLRAPSKNPPPRNGFAIVTADEVAIQISPRWACIEEGESLAFQAEVTGIDGDPEIDWTATAGFFNGSTYTAPGSKVGNVTITATLVGEDISDSVTIRVDECLCYWAADFSGGLSGSFEGEYAVFEDVFAGGESSTQFTLWPSTTDNRPAIYSTSVPKMSNTFTGSLESIVIVNFDNSSNSDWNYSIDNETGEVLTRNYVTANSGDVRAGIISGQLEQIDLSVFPPLITYAGLNVRYIARRKTGGNNPCE